ncbi:ankyrin repeat domain-containing protein [Shewanella sediminis]|nr:ankyrin repeat domain-containing protein [Shewanella sediminis]
MMTSSLSIKSILLLLSVNLAVSTFISLLYISLPMASTLDLVEEISISSHPGNTLALDTNVTEVKQTTATRDILKADSKQNPAQVTPPQHGEQTRELMNYFFAAARTGDIELLTHFIDAGFPIDQRNAQSYTALMVAAYNGQERATLSLLARGSNACLQDKRGNTAIMGALIKGEWSIMKHLYSQTCDAYLTNKSGMTLNEFALYWGQSERLQQMESSLQR